MSSDKRNYYEKISLRNKTPEEAKIITENFNKNINMAYKVASKYYKTGYWDYEEALQIAQMGLWKACLIWDPNQYRLSTLAYNIMNRDFMDYDRQQKKQPDILFNIEENCVTDDLSLGDVLEDPDADVTNNYEQNEDFSERQEVFGQSHGLHYCRRKRRFTHLLPHRLFRDRGIRTPAAHAHTSIS